MARPPYIGIMGGPKVGKTHFAATLFTSKHIDPTRVIYFDNHGSTDAMSLHQWTAQERYGVKHIAPDRPGDLTTELAAIRRSAVRGTPPYDAIVIDDWSEFAQGDIEERMEDSPDSQAMLNWRDHGDLMRHAARMAHPALIKATVISIFQAAQLPNPLEAKPTKVEKGVVKYVADTRKTMIRPFLQGAFAAWFPYKLDAIFYAWRREQGGNFEFLLQMMPDDKVDVISRWMGPWVTNPRRDRSMLDPSMDKLFDFIAEQQDADVSVSNSQEEGN